MALWCSALRSVLLVMDPNHKVGLYATKFSVAKDLSNNIFSYIALNSFVFPYRRVLFHLTFVSNNYTAAPVEHFKILFSAITLLFRDLLVCLPCMIAFVLDSVSRVGDMIFILKGFLSALCLLGLTSCHSKGQHFVLTHRCLNLSASRFSALLIPSG